MRAKNLRVKICGITNIADALVCANEGADALGFIFTDKSPRYITAEKASEITGKLPPFCERIGVFLDHSIKEIIEISQKCSLSGVQLHGNEDEKYILQLKKNLNLPIIKALRKPSREEFIKFSGENLQAFLIDGYSEDFDLSEIFSICKLPLILAGKLSAENLIENLEKYSFVKYIDLCSSLESSAGKKDHEKVSKFF